MWYRRKEVNNEKVGQMNSSNEKSSKRRKIIFANDAEYFKSRRMRMNKGYQRKSDEIWAAVGNDN